MHEADDDDDPHDQVLQQQGHHRQREEESKPGRLVDPAEVSGIVYARIKSIFCSPSLPLARTRWVRSTFSSHCPLSSKQAPLINLSNIDNLFLKMGHSRPLILNFRLFFLITIGR